MYHTQLIHEPFLNTDVQLSIGGRGLLGASSISTPGHWKECRISRQTPAYFLCSALLGSYKDSLSESDSFLEWLPLFEPSSGSWLAVLWVCLCLLFNHIFSNLSHSRYLLTVLSIISKNTSWRRQSQFRKTSNPGGLSFLGPKDWQRLGPKTMVSVSKTQRQTIWKYILIYHQYVVMNFVPSRSGSAN